VTIKLRYWALVGSRSPYDAPELNTGVKLIGDCYGHFFHQDGTNIVTSTVLRHVRGNVFATRNNEYELLEVDPEYEKLFPNALERMKAACAKSQST
jgi:hypothetical protein